MTRHLIAIALLAGAAPLAAAPNDLRSVAGMQSHNRVLLVFAPSLRDPRLTAQRASIARAALEAADRDLVLVQVGDGQVIGSHDAADRLQRRFGVDPAAFNALLIGKDGHIAYRSQAPIAAAAILRLIDAMPMRRDEMRQRAGAAGAGR